MLSPRCWSADSQRVLISCPQRCRKDLLVVDTSTGEVTSLTSQSEEGSWSLLNIHRDLMVVSCSSPNCPPDLRVGFLPAKGSESKMSWVTLEETQPQADISWQTLNFSPPPEEDNRQYPGLDFNAILLKPTEVTTGGKLPLIVMPHGGPHSVLVSEWYLSTAVLCKMGFSILLGELQCILGLPAWSGSVVFGSWFPVFLQISLHLLRFSADQLSIASLRYLPVYVVTFLHRLLCFPACWL
ncbi:hypothetical protein QQF64_031432 [Cirrhinus molitorella]|uniref:Acylamino-acid-releasing enzyme N-terminal domain-containing protein n=1 Tax=Cirrhinus molitorella TaxID=172907 RepID=A0ABR3MWX1_9TELE